MTPLLQRPKHVRETAGPSTVRQSPWTLPPACGATGGMGKSWIATGGDLTAKKLGSSPPKMGMLT